MDTLDSDYNSYRCWVFSSFLLNVGIQDFVLGSGLPPIVCCFQTSWHVAHSYRRQPRVAPLILRTLAALSSYSKCWTWLSVSGNKKYFFQTKDFLWLLQPEKLKKNFPINQQQWSHSQGEAFGTFEAARLSGRFEGRGFRGQVRTRVLSGTHRDGVGVWQKLLVP